MSKNDYDWAINLKLNQLSGKAAILLYIQLAYTYLEGIGKLLNVPTIPEPWPLVRGEEWDGLVALVHQDRRCCPGNTCRFQELKDESKQNVNSTN